MHRIWLYNFPDICQLLWKLPSGIKRSPTGGIMASWINRVVVKYAAPFLGGQICVLFCTTATWSHRFSTVSIPWFESLVTLSMNFGLFPVSSLKTPWRSRTATSPLPIAQHNEIMFSFLTDRLKGLGWASKEVTWNKSFSGFDSSQYVTGESPGTSCGFLRSILGSIMVCCEGCTGRWKALTSKHATNSTNEYIPNKFIMVCVRQDIPLRESVIVEVPSTQSKAVLCRVRSTVLGCYDFLDSDGILSAFGKNALIESSLVQKSINESVLRLIWKML